MFDKRKKLIENAHIITDSDITFEPIPRPCIVRGRKAHFHKWADKREIVIQERSLHPYAGLTDKAIDLALENVRKGYVSPDFDIYTRHETVAIVEYEDGTVEEVSPTEIKFTGAPCYHMLKI